MAFKIAGQTNIEVTQDTPTDLQMEPVQTNPAELEVMINQTVPAQAQVEPVQPNAAENQTEPVQANYTEHHVSAHMVGDEIPSEVNAPIVEQMAAAVHTIAGPTALTTLVAGATYELKLLPDPAAVGGASTDVIMGCYAIGGEPATDYAGWDISSGETHLIRAAAGGDLYIRKNSATALPCVWQIRRTDA